MKLRFLIKNILFLALAALFNTVQPEPISHFFHAALIKPLAKYVQRISNYINDCPTEYEYWEKYFADNKEEIQNPEATSKKLIDAITNNTYLQHYPEPFRIGASTSAYQIEGGIEYGQDATHDFYVDNGIPTAGNTLNFWNNYEKLIKEFKELTHGNMLRISIQWSRIFPAAGVVDQQALEHYENIVKCMKKNGIEPLIVVNHYTIPTWFQKIGGWEKIENVTHFVELGKKVYTQLAKYIKTISSENTTEGPAFKGYFTGEAAPGIKGNMQLTVEVMKNMAEAHVQLYEAIKGIPEKGTTGLYQYLKAQDPSIQEPRIIIQKNIMPMEPAPHEKNNPITLMKCEVANMLNNDAFFAFFTQGSFEVCLPKRAYVQHTNKWAPYTLDGIGINVYSHRYLQADGKEYVETDPALKTENPNYLDAPQTIARGVKKIYNKLVLPAHEHTGRPIMPIFITENGIATKNDEEGNKKRAWFYQRALNVIAELIKKGYPIVSYTPWAAIDNYEWRSPFNTKNYGMIHADLNNPDAPHYLKPGARFFSEVAQSVNNWAPFLHKKS